MPARIEIGGSAVRALLHRSLGAPRTTIAVWLAIAVLSAGGVFFLRVDNSTSGFLDTRSDKWRTYQRFLQAHGSDEFIAIALRSEAPLDAHVLRHVFDLTTDLTRIPGVRRVDSLSTVPLIRDQGGELAIDPALATGVPEDSDDVQALRVLIRADRIAPRALVSSDERAVALNVILDEDVAGDRESVTNAVVSAAGGEALVSGVPVFRTQINKDTQAETFRRIPLTVALMLAVLLWVVGSPRISTIPLAVGGLGSLVSVGAMGATGVPLTLSTMILPSILLALGCAYAMHVVLAASGVAPTELRGALAGVVAPVSLSGLTTTLGFLAISTTSIDAIRQLSLFGALGVLVITAACVSLVPAVLSLSTVQIAKRPSQKMLGGAVASRIASVCARKPNVVLFAWLGIATLSAVGIARLEVSSDIIRWYPQASKTRQEYEAIRAQFSGISPVNVFVEAPLGEQVITPDVVSAIDRLSAELESREDVGKVLSLADPLRLMRRAIVGDESLPASREEIEQYLLVLESEEQVRDVVSLDYTSASILLRVDDNSSTAIRNIADSVDTWWAQNGVPGFTATPTGIMYEFAREQDAIVRTQLEGLTLALLGIGTALCLVMRSIRRGIVALVPNVLPLVIAYGAMGALGIPLDAATACLGSLALGIAVDDTVHIVTWLERGKRTFSTAEHVVASALSATMPALVASTLAIAVGFLALGLSDFVLIRNLGLVTATVVILCWAADVTLLPVLLVRGWTAPDLEHLKRG